jgi:hypothetical protein
LLGRWSETGVVGVGGLVWLVAVITQQLRRLKDRAADAWVGSLWAGWCGWLALSYNSDLLRARYGWLFVALILATVVSSEPRRQHEVRDGR